MMTSFRRLLPQPHLHPIQDPHYHCPEPPFRHLSCIFIDFLLCWLHLLLRQKIDLNFHPLPLPSRTPRRGHRCFRLLLCLFVFFFFHSFSITAILDVDLHGRFHHL